MRNLLKGAEAKNSQEAVSLCQIQEIIPRRSYSAGAEFDATE